jgi:predicted transcriptional regulator
MKPRPTVTQRLRAAIQADARLPIAIARETGIPNSALYRFLRGGALASRTLDKLAAHLDLDLLPRQPAP